MPEPAGALARFQTAFAAALAGDAGPLEALGLAGPRLAAGLAVHRNTIARGLADALAANFPTVRRLVGEAWFAAAARAFIAASPPRERALIDYGAGFADFLAGFEPAAALPYLADVARIDRLWLEAHLAEDAAAWTAAQAAATPPPALFALRLALHPAARIHWCEAFNAPTIWTLNRPGAPEPAASDLNGRPEGVLLTRPGGAVESLILDRASWRLLDACRQGRALGEAVAAVLDADAGLDLPGLLLALVRSGAFAEPAPASPAEAPR